MFGSKRNEGIQEMQNRMAAMAEGLRKKGIEIVSLKNRIARYEQGRPPQEVEKLTAELQSTRRQLEQAQATAEKARAEQEIEHRKRIEAEQQKKSAEDYVVKMRAEFQTALSEKDRQIRKQSNTINDLNEQLKEYKSIEADLRNQLKESNGKLKSTEEKLNSTEEKLTCAEKKLEEKKVNESPDTSSTPSSLNKPKKKIPNNRKSSGKPQGGQPGHEGHKRPDLKANQPPVYLPAGDKIRNDPNWEELPENKWRIRKKIDLMVMPKITEYISKGYKNKITGEIYYPEFPEDIPNETNYGISVKTFAFIGNKYCNVSLRKVSEFISEITCGAIKPSTGFVFNLLQEYSRKTEKERQSYFETLLKSPYMNVDFTNARCNGHSRQVAVMTNGEVCMHFYREKKGFEGLKDTPLEDYRFILISDHDATFYHYGSAHQECFAHLLRYLLGESQLDTDRTWHAKMHDFLQRIIHEFKLANGSLPDKRIEEIENEYKDIVELGRKEYKKYLDGETECPEYYKKSFNLWKRFEESLALNNHLLFLHVKFPELEDENKPLSGCLPFSNNDAERLARGVKMALKAMVTLRSDESGVYLCDALDIFRTCNKRGESVYDKTREIFGRPGHNKTRKTRAEKNKEREAQMEQQRAEEERNRVAEEERRKREKEEQDAIRNKKKEADRLKKQQEREEAKAAKAAARQAEAEQRKADAAALKARKAAAKEAANAVMNTAEQQQSVN